MASLGGTRNIAAMQHADVKPARIEIDAYLVRELDQYREFCPAINRSALVNQILLEWVKSEKIRNAQIPTRLRQS